MTVVQPGIPVTYTAEAGFTFVQVQSAPVEHRMVYGLLDPSAPDPFLGTYPMFATSTAATTAGWVGGMFSRPIVTRDVPGIAQPTPGTLAIGVMVSDPTGTGGVGFDPASVTLTASALDMTIQSQPMPLPGPSPRLAHVRCGENLANGRLRVAQQVLRVSQPLAPVAEIVQTFGVPVTVTAERVELAIPTLAAALPIEVSIVDPGTNPVPGLDPLPVTATSALLDPGTPSTVVLPAWVSTPALGAPAFLVPGRTYWLTLKVRNAWTPGADVSSGGSGYPAGHLYTRSAETQAFAENPIADLSFRIIGTPVTPPPPSCTTPVVVYQPTVNASAFVWGAPVYQAVSGTPHHKSGDRSFFVDESGVIRFATTAPGVTAAEPAIGGLPTSSSSLVLPMADTYPLAYPSTLVAEGDGWWTLRYPRPLVIEAVTGTAHVSGPELLYGFELAAADPWPLAIGYLHDAPPSVTLTATAIVKVGDVWQPLPGANPRLAVEVCEDPDAASLEPLKVLQQVLRVTQPLEVTTTAEVVQTFRVPFRSQVSWAELAIRGEQVPATGLTIKILDPGTLTIPPPEPLPVTATAETQTFTLVYDGHAQGTAGVWVGTLVSSGLPLDPGKDYWLLVRTNGGWALGAHNVTATAYTEGRCYTRAQTTGPFAELVDTDLSFRLIGTPRDPVAVSWPPAAPGQLALTAGPNPFHDEMVLRWRGGTGRLRVEVRDVSGRVVRRERDVGDAREGSWRWRGEDDRGRRVAPGVYFVRARSGDGRDAASRVVFVR